MREALTARQFTSVYLGGSMSVHDRRRAVEAFQGVSDLWRPRRVDPGQRQGASSRREVTAR